MPTTNDSATAEQQQPSMGVLGAARLLHVHPDTIRRWADAGLLPSWRTPTNQRRFRIEDVERMLEPQQEGDA